MPAEVKTRHEEHQKQINGGTIVVKQWKQRSDIGAKRPRKVKARAPAVGAEDTDEDECPHKRRAAKSAEAVDSDED